MWLPRLRKRYENIGSSVGRRQGQSCKRVLPHDVDPNSDYFRHCLRGMFDVMAKATADLGVAEDGLPDYQMDDMELSLWTVSQ